MPQNYRPGLDVVRLAALLPVLCYHYCIEAARLGFAVPTALIGRGMADWVEVGLAWFFLLSGAALCLQWQGRFEARRYFVGRAAATYPAFWLGFGALFLYGEVLHGNNADIPRWRVMFSVLGLDGYLAPVTVTFYKIGEWFLGVILILYLVFPLLLRCMETAAHRRVLALCMAVLAVVWPLVCPAPWEAGHTVLGRLPAFALGVWFGTLLKKNAFSVLSAVYRAGGLPAFVGGRSAASGRAVGAGVGAVLGSLCRRAARTRTALPRPAAAGGLVLRRVPGASCPADAGIPAVCAGARPAAGRDVPGVSRRQLCAGGGADGNEQTGEQGSQKIGIKNRTHSFSRLCVCFCIHKGRFCIRPCLSANGAASRAFSSYCRACKAASSGGMSCFLRLTTPGSLAMFPSGSTWNASRMISSALWP